MEVVKEYPKYLYEERSIIQYIRDLVNLSNLLERGIDEELRLLVSNLKAVGWSDENITRFITIGSTGTRYERITDPFGRRIVPPTIPTRGDYSEYKRNKHRVEK